MTISYPGFANLSGKRVVLASTSPRRRELFDRMGFNYEIVPSNFAEDLAHSAYADATAYCMATCKGKSDAVLEALKNDLVAPSVIVSADTIVECNGSIYEKPSDRQDAGRMLRELSGNVIRVITAVFIRYRNANGQYETISFDEVTEMSMADLDATLIEAYLEQGQGMDHSAALSYQGAAFLLVSSINGCFYNLIGFPAPRFYKEMTFISHLIN